MNPDNEIINGSSDCPLFQKFYPPENFWCCHIKPRFKKDQASLTKNGPLNTDFLLKDTMEQNLNC